MSLALSPLHLLSLHFLYNFLISTLSLAIPHSSPPLPSSPTILVDYHHEFLDCPISYTPWNSNVSETETGTMCVFFVVDCHNRMGQNYFDRIFKF